MRGFFLFIIEESGGGCNRAAPLSQILRAWLQAPPRQPGARRRSGRPRPNLFNISSPVLCAARACPPIALSLLCVKEKFSRAAAGFSGIFPGCIFPRGGIIENKSREIFPETAASERSPLFLFRSPLPGRNAQRKGRKRMTQEIMSAVDTEFLRSGFSPRWCSGFRRGLPWWKPALPAPRTPATS